VRTVYPCRVLFARAPVLELYLDLTPL